MTTQKKMAPVTIDAIIREARAEQAKRARMVAAGLQAKLKRFVAGFRPIRARTPRTGAMA